MYRMSSEFRPLYDSEIAQLQKQGCTCSDWGSVKVCQDFNAERVSFAHFSGEVEIGRLEKSISLYGGITRPAGITGATIHNCKIGNNVYINNVENYISNYTLNPVRLKNSVAHRIKRHNQQVFENCAIVTQQKLCGQTQ